MRTDGEAKSSRRATPMVLWGRRILGIGALLAIGTIGYAIWGAVQQLGYLSSADILSGSPRSNTTAEPETSRVEPEEDEIRAAEPSQVPRNSPIVLSDPVRERFEAGASTATAWDESPDDRASLQGMLDDPDPDVRAEAAALLELLDAELALSPP